MIVFFVLKKDSRALILSARDMIDSERKDMGKSKSSISKAKSYKEIGDFWDTHDLSGYWDQTKPVRFDIDIQSEAIYYPVEQKRSAQLSAITRQHGVFPENLLNLRVAEADTSLRMKVDGVIWLRSVVDKLRWKHSVTTEEVEAVFSRSARYRFLERGEVQGEDLYAALGRTEAGRYLIVYFLHKVTGEALVISARDMTKKERRLYGKK